MFRCLLGLFSFTSSDGNVHTAFRFIDSKSGLWEPDVELSKALQIAVASPLLNEISRERIWAELRRILQGPRADEERTLRLPVHKVVSFRRNVWRYTLVQPKRIPPGALYSQHISIT